MFTRLKQCMQYKNALVDAIKHSYTRQGKFEKRKETE